MPLFSAFLSRARRAYNPLAVCKTLATVLSAMRPAMHHSAVHQEESYVAAELGIARAKPELVCKEATLFVVAFLAVAVHR